MQNILGQGQACSVCTSKKSWFSAPKLTLCPLQPSIGVKTRSGSEVSVDVMSPPLCCRTTKYDSVKQTFWTPRQQYSSDLVWNLCHTFMMIWCGFVQTWGNPKECCFRTKTCGHHLCRETWLYQTISTYIHIYIYIWDMLYLNLILLGRTWSNPQLPGNEERTPEPGSPFLLDAKHIAQIRPLWVKRYQPDLQISGHL